MELKRMGSMNQEPTRGRPPLPKGTAATSQIQLRVQMKRKAAYVRAAKGMPLAEWCFKHLDAASGYEDTTDSERKGNDLAHQRKGEE
jgi:hypothetical protein